MASAAAPPPRPPATATWRLALVGLGNVGSGVLDLLLRAREALRARHGVELVVTGVADRDGAAVDHGGLDLAAVLDTVRGGRRVGSLDRAGAAALSPADMIAAAGSDIVLEATPVDLHDGEPALGTVLAALAAGRHVVLANKAPLALAYARLRELADMGGGPPAGAPRPQLRFSACVGGALPVVNLGLRDLAGTRILRFEGVLNGTSQSILRAMEAGDGFAAALRDAQRRGIAEADPSLDVDGLDAACKLVIVANAVLGRPTTLADVRVRGIRDLRGEDVRRAAARGGRVVLLAVAERTGDGFRLSVGPVELAGDHPLARLDADEMGVVYATDAVDRITAASLEPRALPASAAMLRDMLDIARHAAPAPATPGRPRHATGLAT